MATNAILRASAMIGNRVKVHHSIKAIRAARRELGPCSSVGFVPTMGALHDGHLSLVKEARSRNDFVIASIFVNPTQFGVGEDLDKYPRQMEQDTQLLEDLGVDHIFAPTNETMYGKNHKTFVEALGFESISEGISRPGHFRGVATIVTKLLNIVQPTHAYFGQKDAAQCCLIRRIVQDLNIPVEIMIRDTVRESDGLAMSSRNAYLTVEERQAAPIVYASLVAARKRYQATLTDKDNDSTCSISSKELVNTVEQVLKSEPLVKEIQYVSVDNVETMMPLTEVDQGGAVISIACKIGDVRLIDNIIIKV